MVPNNPAPDDQPGDNNQNLTMKCSDNCYQGTSEKTAEKDTNSDGGQSKMTPNDYATYEQFTDDRSINNEQLFMNEYDELHERNIPLETDSNTGDQDTILGTSTNNAVTTKQVCCKTCDSTKECEEDIDNHGDYYCKCCWEDYAVLSQQQEIRCDVESSNRKSSIHIESKSDNKNNQFQTTQSLTTQSASYDELLQTQAMALTKPQDQVMSQSQNMSQDDLEEEKVVVEGEEAMDHNWTYSDQHNDIMEEAVDKNQTNSVDKHSDENEKFELQNNESDVACVSTAVAEGAANESLRDGSTIIFQSANAQLEGDGAPSDERQDASADTVVHQNVTNNHNDVNDGSIEQVTNTRNKLNDIDNFFARNTAVVDPSTIHNDVDAKVQNFEDADSSRRDKKNLDNSLEVDDHEVLTSNENVDDYALFDEVTNLYDLAKGLLTQAASMSEDDDIQNSAALEEVNGNGEGMGLEYEEEKANNSHLFHPPTIETTEQAPLSGLTAPSQSILHKCQQNRTQLRNKDTVIVKEMEIDQNITKSATQTEESFWSLYTAETQLLPSQTPKRYDVKTSSKLKQADVTSNSVHNEETGDWVDNEEQNCSGQQVDNDAADNDSARNKIAECSEVQMKLLTQNGVLSTVSYPNNQINEAHEANAVGDENHHLDETEISQDLLETSPMSGKREEEQTYYTDGMNMESVGVGISEVKRVNYSPWLSTHDKSSTRLVLPELKSNEAKNTHNSSVSKLTEQDAAIADESDDESMFENHHTHALDNVPLEDTQTQDLNHHPKPSKLKRLSRGTPAHSSNEAEEKSTCVSLATHMSGSSTGKKRFGRHSNMGSKTSMMPKILQYTRNNEYIESEDEDINFGKNNDKNQMYEHSQTDYRALKQIEEARKLAEEIPSAEELSELASRNELRHENEELRLGYSKKITSLKNEKNKLRRLIKQKDITIEKMEDIIKEKDGIIKDMDDMIEEKRAIIEKQRETITFLMDRIRGVSSRKSKIKEHDDSHDDSDEGSVVLSALKRFTQGSDEKERSDGKCTVESHKAKRTPRCAQNGIAKARPFSPEIWKELQAKGWKYKTGPEPYNKVYVPPDGSTHAGTRIGIHFFYGEHVLDAAIKRGHIEDTKSNTTIESVIKIENELGSESENGWNSSREVEQEQADAHMDDLKLVGDSNITLETGRVSIELVISFMEEDQDTVSFRAALFDPIWQRLKSQGEEIGLNWKYERCTKMAALSRNWCCVPPLSDLGSKGMRGFDYFVTEEETVLHVLQEVQRLSEFSSLITANITSITPLIKNLSYAIENDMEYEDARSGKNPKIRRRRRTAALLEAAAEEIEVSEKKNSYKPSKPTRTPPPTGKRKTPNTSFSEKSSITKKKKQTNISPAFHSSQTQENEVILPFGVRSPTSAGPLSGYEFFCSAVSNKKSITARIRALGGKVVSINKDTASKSPFKLFFISEYSAWRRPKYMFAAALGCPMLHYEWITDMEKKVKNGENAKAMSSDLYQRYRLPIGLDHSSGVFHLQRASHARDWLRPGFTRSEDGSPVFEGMNIAIAVDPACETEWQVALIALGAKVITTNSLRGKGQLHNVDCCLLASVMLPPQVIATPLHVSQMLKHIPDDKPLLDLAWAHQCIIQRRRLPLTGDPRYIINLNNGIIKGALNVYAIKNDIGRYEVGDLIQFSIRSKNICYGRIVGITWVEGKGRLEIQILQNNGNFELIDCPSSAKVFVEESSIQGNIVMLGSKDMRNLGYLPKDPLPSNIFRQVKQLNPSQI